MTASPISPTPIEPDLPVRDTPQGCFRTQRTHEDRAAGFAGLPLGTLGGAALGIGAGLAWVEIFKTTSFEGYSGMLVFFTFMPAGAAMGGIGGALLFGILAIRDAEIAIERDLARRRDR